MDEFEFRRLLEMFPVVRPRDFHVDTGSSRQLTRFAHNEEVKEQRDAGSSKVKRGSDINKDVNHEDFWGKLKLAAEQKMGTADAERFYEAFQQVYNKLVYEELTLDAARSFLNS